MPTQLATTDELQSLERDANQVVQTATTPQWTQEERDFWATGQRGEEAFAAWQVDQRGGDIVPATPTTTSGGTGAGDVIAETNAVPQNVQQQVSSIEQQQAQQQQALIAGGGNEFFNSNQELLRDANQRASDEIQAMIDSFSGQSFDSTGGDIIDGGMEQMPQVETGQVSTAQWGGQEWTLGGTGSQSWTDPATGETWTSGAPQQEDQVPPTTTTGQGGAEIETDDSGFKTATDDGRWGGLKWSTDPNAYSTLNPAALRTWTDPETGETWTAYDSSRLVGQYHQNDPVVIAAEQAGWHPGQKGHPLGSSGEYRVWVDPETGAIWTTEPGLGTDYSNFQGLDWIQQGTIEGGEGGPPPGPFPGGPPAGTGEFLGNPPGGGHPALPGLQSSQELLPGNQQPNAPGDPYQATDSAVQNVASALNDRSTGSLVDWAQGNSLQAMAVRGLQNSSLAAQAGTVAAIAAISPLAQQDAAYQQQLGQMALGLQQDLIRMDATFAFDIARMQEQSKLVIDQMNVGFVQDIGRMQEADRITVGQMQEQSRLTTEVIMVQHANTLEQMKVNGTIAYGQQFLATVGTLELARLNGHVTIDGIEGLTTTQQDSMHRRLDTYTDNAIQTQIDFYSTATADDLAGEVDVSGEGGGDSGFEAPDTVEDQFIAETGGQVWSASNPPTTNQEMFGAYRQWGREYGKFIQAGGHTNPELTVPVREDWGLPSNYSPGQFPFDPDTGENL